MNKVKLNPMVEHLQGSFGEVVFRQSASGRIFASHKPDMSNVVWSKAQTAQRERFRLATAYAHAAMADEHARSVYEREAATQGKRAFHLAVADYFKGRNLLAKK